MPDSTTSTPFNPNEQVAELIVQVLRDEKLINENKAPEIFTKLAKGIATRDDWRLWLDIPPAEKEAS